MPDETETSSSSRSRTAAYVAIPLVIIAISAALAFWSSSKEPAGVSRTEIVKLAEDGPAFAARFVGDRACRECHPGESALNARSGHSRTLRPAARVALLRGLNGRRVPDPERPGVTWSFHVGAETAELEQNEGGKSDRRAIEFAFGSGRHALSFLTTQPESSSDLIDPAALEHRISYYTLEDKLDLSPGHESSATPAPGTAIVPEGRTLNPERARHCLSCHATLMSNRGNEHLDPASMLPNIGCERCHGPGREHVADARREDPDLWMPNGLDELDPDKQLLLCGECHRHRSAISSSLMNPANTAIVRFQPVGLSLSRCYRSGLSGLRCTTCHDPHAPPSTDRAAYERQCLNCHKATPQRLCSLEPSPRSGC